MDTVARDTPPSHHIAEPRDQVETFAAQQYASTQVTVANTASETATLRNYLRQGLLLIDDRIADDRQILGSVQSRVDAVETHQGLERTELHHLCHHITTLESQIVDVRGQVATLESRNDMSVRILHSEIHRSTIDIR